MAVRQEIIDAFNKDIERKKQRVRDGTYIQAREKYIRDKKRGDYSIVIEEWDDFQRERELKEALEHAKNNKIEEIIDMSERQVTVRLSKAFNNVEVVVSDIKSRDEFSDEVLWAKNEAYKLIDMLPNEKIDSYLTKPDNQVKATPKEYVEAVQYTKPPQNGVYTAQHVTTKFLKGKQINIALKGLNSGKYTLDQVNGLQSWEEQQALLFPPRKY